MTLEQNYDPKCEPDFTIDHPRERRETLAFAIRLVLFVAVFYTGFMQLVLWSSPWWTQGAEFLVGR